MDRTISGRKGWGVKKHPYWSIEKFAEKLKNLADHCRQRILKQIDEIENIEEGAIKYSGVDETLEIVNIAFWLGRG